MTEGMDLAAAISKIEELTRNNTDLLDKIKKRNAEAKDYRESQEAFRDATGIDVGKLKDVFGKLKTGELTLDELPNDQKIALEKLRPTLIDADAVLGKTPAKQSAGLPKTQANNTQQDKPQEAASGNDEVERLRAENQRLKLSHELLAGGVIPSAVEKALKIWEEPQIAEGQDAQTVRAEALAAFKADNPYFFAQDVQATQGTPQPKQPVIPPHNGAAAGTANQNAQIEAQIAEAERRGDVEALIRIAHEQNGLIGGR